MPHLPRIKLRDGYSLSCGKGWEQALTSVMGLNPPCLSKLLPASPSCAARSQRLCPARLRDAGFCLYTVWGTRCPLTAESKIHSALHSAACLLGSDVAHFIPSVPSPLSSARDDGPAILKSLPQFLHGPIFICTGLFLGLLPTIPCAPI